MSFENIETLEDQLLIELDREKEKTNSGIFLPSSTAHKDRGTIRVLGPGERISNAKLETGNYVVFEKGKETEVKIDDVEAKLVVVNIENVLLKINQS